MRSTTDLLQSEFLAARQLWEVSKSTFHDARKQMALSGIGLSDTPAQQMIERMGREDAMRRSLLVDQATIQTATEAARFLAEQDRWRRAMAMPSLFEEARRAAELAQSFQLPKALLDYRTPAAELAARLEITQAAELWRRPEYLAAFGQASAMADLYAESTRVSRMVAEASRAIMIAPMPGVGSLVEYRGFLDAAGLTLPRWPRVRLLTTAEKRRRFKTKLKGNVEPPHVKWAKSLVHRYELTMRDILDGVMAETYGENWPEERLPLCDCKDLLGKWKKRGGDVLDHADYAHYARIMSHPAHFEAVFRAGFDDAQETHELLVKAGTLRARSHHPHTFTAEDLRDLRLTWRSIEMGLVALDGDYTLDF